MKKLILSLAAITAFGAANAQQMGDIFVNGSIGYMHSSSEVSSGSTTVDGPTTSRFMLTPSIGYQFDRNWGVGIAFGYDISRIKETPSGSSLEAKQTTRTLGVGPFIRYTQPLSPMFFLYGQLNAMYVNGKATVEVSGNKTTLGNANGFDVNVMPAVGINLSRHIAVTGSFGRLGFASVKSENPNNSSDYYRQNAFEATFGREFNLGVQWNFNGTRTRRNRVEPMSETRRMDRYRDSDDDTNGDRNEAPRRRNRRR